MRKIRKGIVASNRAPQGRLLDFVSLEHQIDYLDNKWCEECGGLIDADNRWYIDAIMDEWLVEEISEMNCSEDRVSELYRHYGIVE